MTGAKNCLEGESGLYRLYFGGKYGADILTADLGKSFEGVNVAFKRYPCCRGIHPAIDSALAVTRQYSIVPDEIHEIRLFVSEKHYSLLCAPLDAKRRPRNPVDGQFSIPWGVATAIARGGATLDDFTEEAIQKKRILNITGKMTVEWDNTLKRPDKVDLTRVQIETKGGAVFTGEAEDPLGSLQRPMSFDDCAAKFRGCAKGLSEDRSERAVEMIRDLENAEDISEIIDQFSME